ncbi:hypothetical protein SD457_07800 [Coprobacillaceae bacterium CR2/5/TPMF4]|nr:hypothetical protein SD457_07800 [Coprobacillaceae bacterium CR2/5/TPMF4]
MIYCFIALGLLMYVSMSSMFNYPIPSIVRENPYVNIALQIIF